MEVDDQRDQKAPLNANCQRIFCAVSLFACNENIVLSKVPSQTDIESNKFNL